MNDGAGGELMQEFISKHITSHFPRMNSEIPLDALDDSAVVDDIVFTIDGHTVNPLFFPGGDIGRIAISGTVNDIRVFDEKFHDFSSRSSPGVSVLKKPQCGTFYYFLSRFQNYCLLQNGIIVYNCSQGGLNRCEPLFLSM